jgi:hypothetical protein
MDRDIFVVFGDRGNETGGRRGRLFGLGWGSKREWMSQFFRMDYHRSHAANQWVDRGNNGNEFHFETPSYEQEPW